MEQEGEVKQSQIAESIARKAHAGQFRRDGVTPYITHPEAVAAMFKDDTLKAIAWLHDVIEDTEYSTGDIIDEGISDDVITALMYLTHDPAEDYWSYVNGVSVHRSATLVKLADIFHNLSSNPTDKQKRKYADAVKILINAI